MANINGQVAIVTGSATGIGYGVIERLSKEGAKIVMVDFDSDMAQKASTELAEKGIDIEIVIGDVANPDTAQEAAKKAIDTWGRIEILVNKAGIGCKNGNIWELDVE